MFESPGGLESQPLDWCSKPTIRSLWELFRDWGYRIEPEFALMFASSRPQKVTEHLNLVEEQSGSPLAIRYLQYLIHTLVRLAYSTSPFIFHA
jgi:hypothetical protein